MNNSVRNSWFWRSFFTLENAIYQIRRSTIPSGGDFFSTKKVSLVAILIALGVAISPMLWFPILDSKAFPGQHIINVIAGVLLGPIWAGIIAFIIGIIRMSLSVGTIFSMPGGIPGAFFVGLTCWFFKKSRTFHQDLAAFTEPLGTVLIGGTLAVYFFAPFVGRNMLLFPVWLGWSLSSVPGCVIGFIILKTLRRTGILVWLNSDL